jgi:hypothetical protein
MKKTLLIGIAALFLTGTAHAAQRDHAIPGKPKIIVRHITLLGAVQPPPKYDVPYTGDLEIVFFTHNEDIQPACGAHSDFACAQLWSDQKKCRIQILTEDALKKRGHAYNFALRHELAHCNGWRHPPTTGGRHFNVGEKWDEAEGGKWVAADTQRPAPKLPESTRILPAPSKIVCVTPEWKEESCANRKEGAWSYNQGAHHAPITTNICPLSGKPFDAAYIPRGCFTK